MKVQDLTLIIFVCLFSMYGYMFLKHYSIRTEVELEKLEAITQITERLGQIVEMRFMQTQHNDSRNNVVFSEEMERGRNF